MRRLKRGLCGDLNVDNGYMRGMFFCEMKGILWGSGFGEELDMML